MNAMEVIQNGKLLGSEIRRGWSGDDELVRISVYQLSNGEILELTGRLS